MAVTHVTLDGVMQAPARRDEDPRDGFPMEAGRRATGTYEDSHLVWPHRDVGATDVPGVNIGAMQQNAPGEDGNALVRSHLAA